MSRKVSVDPEMVRGVISTSLGDNDIESSIATAGNLFDSILGTASMQAGLQVEIVRFLAAHFVSLKDPSSRPSSEKMGDASVSYSDMPVNSEGGFLSTVWGQTAASLDPTGSLLGRIASPPRMFSL